MKTDSLIISKHKDGVFQRVKHLKKYIRRAHHSFQFKPLGYGRLVVASSLSCVKHQEYCKDLNVDVALFRDVKNRDGIPTYLLAFSKRSVSKAKRF